jgi:hypothetical protein
VCLWALLGRCGEGSLVESPWASMAVESSAAGDQELVTKTLQIEHKLFYLDLKENPRGRYLKISEKTSGARSTIIVPIAGVVWFVDLFNYYANGDDNDLSSKELQLDTKVGQVLLMPISSHWVKCMPGAQRVRPGFQNCPMMHKFG